jgi:hypothetical protein
MVKNEIETPGFTGTTWPTISQSNRRMAASRFVHHDHGAPAATREQHAAHGALPAIGRGQLQGNLCRS